MMMWSQDGCLGLIDLDHVMVECLHRAPGPDIHQRDKLMMTMMTPAMARLVVDRDRDLGLGLWNGTWTQAGQ